MDLNGDDGAPLDKSNGTLPGRITAATARTMAARSAQARRERAAALIERLREPAPADESDAYAKRQLARVRVLLDDVDEQLAKTRDPQDRERLARAANTLSERERVLSGRPLPGSRRPGKDRAPVEADVLPLG